ncbi:hypothetical protein NJC38_16065 [Pseudomonas sp. 21LCFQ010]|uniref:hypothetical protein n=1 Tax=Pseudomonas sp. 21LCFQ010 TaxID=2957506 RepID=UPI0020981EE6|nr:hypothetical protein [Pseudomonas sp. 21LCFQ010]MCO8163673.1 hypothetical protein [Pseudomonas sp. 21LCFQ010]
MSGRDERQSKESQGVFGLHGVGGIVGVALTVLYCLVVSGAILRVIKARGLERSRVAADRSSSF